MTKREPVCTECSHGERAYKVNDPAATLHPPAERLERYPTTKWRWWFCPHCNSVWVMRLLFSGVKLRIGYLEDGTSAWHDVHH